MIKVLTVPHKNNCLVFGVNYFSLRDGVEMF
jgi:hypothetical protein